MRTEAERIKLFDQMMKTTKISRDFRMWLYDNGFFKSPASTKFHGNYEGGLFDHSYEVAVALVDMTQRLYLPWWDQRSPYIVGMFHDLCKIDNYSKIIDVPGVELFGTDEIKGEDAHWVYNPDTLLPGHGAKSVQILCQHMQLTEEEVLCIRHHMGAYEKDEWDFYDRAIRKYPNVLYTHTADMVASKVVGV